MKVHWLACIVSPGQFSNEYTVKGETFNGQEFALFAPDNFVDCGENEPSWEQPVLGWLQIKVIGKVKNILLVRLPMPPLEGPQTITVQDKKVSLREAPQKA